MSYLRERINLHKYNIAQPFSENNPIIAEFLWFPAFFAEQTVQRAGCLYRLI